MDEPASPRQSTEAIDAFIDRWRGATGMEIADFQPFIRELSAALGLPDAPPETGDPEKDE